MKTLVSLFLCVLWASCVRAQLSPEWNLFQSFLQRYEKSYRNDSVVSQKRFQVFKDSLRRHEWLNSYEARHGGTAVYGVNKFSDLTPEEFKERYLSGLRRGDGLPPKYNKDNSFLALTNPPDKFDWREKDVIGSIRNQKRCGSCWAFAVVETITSRYAIQSGQLVELSPQQLISCDTAVGLDGCDGGVLQVAFSSITSNGTVIVKESEYPFESGDGKSHACRKDLPNVGLKLLNYIYLENNRTYQNNEMTMLSWLVNSSPLTTSVNANAWQDYTGGIIQHHCSGATIDHAVQIVGYDRTGPVPYWITRNTWGTDWGEDGYVKLKFGDNMCGLTDEVAYVTDVQGVNLTN